MRSYLYPGKRATDKRARSLAPDEIQLHDRWLQALTDRAPEARVVGERLVSVLRAQADKEIVIDAEFKARVGGDALTRGQHLHRIFWAGLLSLRGGRGSPAKIHLYLF